MSETHAKLKCEYCDLTLIDCLKHFEVTAMLNTDLIFTHVDDKTFDNINDGIKWAKSKGADFIEVYQGCDRNNQILQLNL
jgi:hypothetical protein